MLYGRTAQQAELGKLLDAARAGRSGVVVLRGEAGIGKTALLDWAAGTASGMRVLRVQGVEAESELPFAGLVQLLWPIQRHIGALPAPQAGALRAVLGQGPAEAADRFSTGLATLTLLAELAESGPLLCLVDDAHWLDQASADALLFAARRLAAEGVAMVFAARDEDGFAAAGAAELRLPRLDGRVAADLLAGWAFAPDLRDRIIAESAGNPLALVEFAAGQGAHPGDRPEAERLPVADRVLAAFGARLAALPEPVRLVTLLAATGGRSTPAVLLRAAKRLETGPEDLERAERAGLLRVGADAVTFRHPLIATAAYQGASFADRIAVHRALAEETDVPDCRANHLLALTTAPDDQVAAELADAAGRARRRTAYASAARLYERAAALTPAEHVRAERLAEAAAAALLAGRTEQAADLALRAEPLFTGHHGGRDDLARVRSAVEFERGEPGRAAEILIERARHAEPDAAAEMLRTAAGHAWFSGRPDPIRAAAARLRELGRADASVQGMAHLLDGDPGRGLPLLAEHVESARKTPRDGGDRLRAIYGSVILGDDESTLTLAAAEIEEYRTKGLIARLPPVLQAQAQAQTRVGLHRDAIASVAEAAAIARDTGLRRRAEELDVVLAWIAAIEGDEERCRGLAHAATDSSRVAADCALSLLDLSLGRPEQALRRLASAWRGPGRHVSVLMASAADHIEAAVRLGRPQEAEAPLRRFRAWAEGGGIPWALAVAARCAALLGEGEEAYLRALELHRQGGRPFERARTELLYGEWLRRARRRSAARAPLRSALATFERLGAAPWIERTRTELRAAGDDTHASRPAAAVLTDRLTSQELQVIRLAAEGHSSREIGARLFLSRRTVEYHLYKAYPKLGVTSRRELAALDLAGR
ncbi:helix-turn-helix transcriptional regulator [Spongiactinospora rosea]|uniref:Helix-turn-helix transcriptional regulator n=1 Tax=Spongiactinospora rosea TaxID=2248750 RepID=A0A366LS13_9ACTN|nr:LuxR family transcriptional regulator [Spongiactinospora rosea]RBQ16698.1 helix-turn-helix transcriptional regulator [Spongiactinospora rosea]